MNTLFSLQLQTLRTNARLTNNELATLADVPESLISGLQNNNRRVGELQARKLANALNLTGEALEEFILQAINTSTEKVLNQAKPYPAHLLNLIAVQLHRAGIDAQAIRGFSIAGDDKERDVTLSLGNGRSAVLKTQLVCA